MTNEYSKFTFRELSKDDNQLIVDARRSGFSTFFPAFPDAKAQAERTLEAARQFLIDQGKIKPPPEFGSLQGLDQWHYRNED